ncbi:MAG: hypothetical protein K6G52_03405, partial [Treponemataceae bacterium]|nr:hypothetical protein [Treponemataceae bacterium]
MKLTFNNAARKLFSFVLCSFSLISFACAKSADEEKLESLFAKRSSGEYPFTNVLGEAPEMADYILKNKAAFIADLNYVLENDKDDLLLLIDKTHKVSSAYKPADLIPLTDKTHYNFYR